MRASSAFLEGRVIVPRDDVRCSLPVFREANLKFRSLPEPKQLLERRAAFLDGANNIAAPAHEISEQGHDVQKGGLAAGVGANQCPESSQGLIDGLEATVAPCLDTREHAGRFNVSASSLNQNDASRPLRRQNALAIHRPFASARRICDVRLQTALMSPSVDAVAPECPSAGNMARIAACG